MATQRLLKVLRTCLNHLDLYVPDEERTGHFMKERAELLAEIKLAEAATQEPVGRLEKLRDRAEVMVGGGWSGWE